ncbi:MAG: hypothetical protein KTR25_17630 [Myxococcales bacterium]|nr:hypothetical protein [Myxococcales bacterium]
MESSPQEELVSFVGRGQELPEEDRGNLSSTDLAFDDAPLDEATLKLMQELLRDLPEENEVSQESSKGPKNLPEGHWYERNIPKDWLHLPLGRTLDESLEALPLILGDARGRSRLYRRLDDLRLEPDFVDIGRFDPLLYDHAMIRRSPSAGEAGRIWQTDVVIRGRTFPMAKSEPYDAYAVVESRSLDRGLGVVAGMGGRTSIGGIFVGARLDTSTSPHTGTSTGTATSNRLFTRMGASLRGYLGADVNEPIRVDIGYDFDTGLQLHPSDETPSGVHLFQTTVRGKAQRLSSRVTLGWMGRHEPRSLRSLFQMEGRLRWDSTKSEELPRVVMVNEQQDGVWAQSVRRWAPIAVAEVGGLVSGIANEGLHRAEIFASTEHLWGPLRLEFSARGHRQASTDWRFTVDARTEISVAGPLSLWGRYSRNYDQSDELELRNVIVELVEGGPQLRTSWGWLVVGAWHLDGVAETEDWPKTIANDDSLWLSIDGLPRGSSFGGYMEGGADFYPLTMFVALSWDNIVGPADGGEGRFSARYYLPAMFGFLEVVAQARNKPQAQWRLSLRGEAAIVGGWRVRGVLSNVFDVDWREVGTNRDRTGTDFRLAMSWNW